jgi:hypothetical protein
MRTLVLLNPRWLTRWHGWLISSLAMEAQHSVIVRVATDPAPEDPVALRRLIDLERMLGGGRPAACDRLDVKDVGLPLNTGLLISDSGFDTAIDLTGARLVEPTAAWLVVRPLYDGQHSEAGLWSALLARRLPALSLELGSGPPRGVALPAVEHPTRLREASDFVLSRLAEVLRAVAVGGPTALPQPPREVVHDRAPEPGLASVALFAAAKSARKAGGALQRLTGGEPRWRVGWRFAKDGRSHIGALPPAAVYRTLPDDGRRYFADPFVRYHDGLHHVFVEELPYRTGKGIISHFTVTADGTPSTPRPVLEGPHHLSYPQVIEHEGAIYMMPECSASGALDLYRADPFPTRWVPHCRLIPHEVHDATYVRHEGRHYIFAATRAFRSSSWDALGVFWSDRLEGPWQPHPSNPLIVDVRESRPAGAMYVKDGSLWRPVQDCSGGYGAALALVLVTKLDPRSYSQAHAGTMRLPGLPAGRGPHTINWEKGLEVIDFLA